MYRKEQRRIREMEDQSQVITRVSSYPIVKDAWSKMSEVYQRGKDGSRVLRFCGGVVESSASMAFAASQPVIGKLPVGMVNDYAVAKLESLEESYPVMVKPTEQVVDAVKAYSTTKLGEATKYSTDKINRIAQATGAGHILGLAETAVDAILPDLKEETDEPPRAKELTTGASTDVVGRAYALGDRVRYRAFQHAMANIGALQKRSEAVLSTLVHTVNLLEIDNEDVWTDQYEKVTGKMVSKYNELPISDNLKKKGLETARTLARRVGTTFRTMSRLARALPAQTRTSIANAYHSAESLYQALLNFDVVSTAATLRAKSSELMSLLDAARQHIVSAGYQINHPLLSSAMDRLLGEGKSDLMLGHVPSHVAGDDEEMSGDETDGGSDDEEEEEDDDEPAANRSVDSTAHSATPDSVD